MKKFFKKFAHVCSVLAVSPCILTCKIEEKISSEATGTFQFWADVMSVLPGIPGAYLRRAYYCYTLQSCSSRCHIGFGTVFAHRQAIVEECVYLGVYALLGSVVLRKGCLVGSRASIISGGAQHQRKPGGGWTSTKTKNLQLIEIGAGAWLGEACVVAASVGVNSMIATGAVVTRKVPDDVMFAGNPARFVKKLSDTEEAQDVVIKPDFPNITGDVRPKVAQ